MHDDVEPSEAFAFADFNAQRMEALYLFDYAVSAGKDEGFQAFIERCVLQEPPPIELLREIAEDVRSRVISLRHAQFEAREQLVAALRDELPSEAAALLPLLDHQPDELMPSTLRTLLGTRGVFPAHKGALPRTTAALELYEHLRYRVQMSEHLNKYVADWVNGIGILAARSARHWSFGPSYDQTNL